MRNDMKLLAFLLATAIIIVSCASSDTDDNNKKKFENLVTLQPPGKAEVKEASIYIDSVTVIQQEANKALLVSGSFPDGCTHLRQASHSRKDQVLHLSIKAWRDPEMMCTQALTPFSFIYNKLSEEDLKALSTVAVLSLIHI